jgi:hypothetical protein
MVLSTYATETAVQRGIDNLQAAKPPARSHTTRARTAIGVRSGVVAASGPSAR